MKWWDNTCTSVYRGFIVYSRIILQYYESSKSFSCLTTSLVSKWSHSMLGNLLHEMPKCLYGFCVEFYSCNQRFQGLWCSPLVAVVEPLHEMCRILVGKRTDFTDNISRIGTYDIYLQAWKFSGRKCPFFIKNVLQYFLTIGE